MNEFIKLISFLVFAVCAFALDRRALNSYKGNNQLNPILTNRYCADPGVMVYDDTVYMYCTNDGEKPNGYHGANTYGQINTLVCLSSKDLVNWTDHGLIKAAGSGGAAKWASNSWAPYAVHKKINGKEKFFLYFANNGSGVGVLTSDSPTGPWKDPIGKALISGSLCQGVTWCFDPAAYVDSDGTGYLYYGGGVPNGADANPKTLRAIKLGNDMISVAGQPVVIDAPCSFEDSGINKVGNTYFYSYCSNWNTGGRMNAAGIMIMTGNSPLGPFTYKGEVFRNPGTFFSGSSGNNHHTIFEFKGSYYIAYHTMTLENKAMGTSDGYRSAHIDKIPFSNGSFGQAKGTLEGPTQIGTLNPYTRVEAETMANSAGILTANVNDSGNTVISDIGNGDWTSVRGVNFSQGLASITASVKASGNTNIKVYTGSSSGTLICTINVSNTNNQFKEVTGNCSNVSGVKDVYFVYGGNMQFDYWKANSTSGGGNAGNTQQPQPTTTSAPQQTLAPVTSVGEGCYFIKNVKSGKYLQVTSGSQNVEVGSKSSANSQKWTIKKSNNGYVTLQNGANGYNLDIAYGTDEDETNVQTYEANGMSAQDFKIVSSSTSGAFGIVTGCSYDKRGLDVYKASTAEGANVIQYTYKGAQNQIWNFESCGGNTSGGSSASGEKCDPDYPCCASCIYYMEDQSGKWGIENNQWCKLKSTCKQSSDDCTGKNQGYQCCNTCDTVYTDESGRWGVMNNDWCGIKTSC